MEKETQSTDPGPEQGPHEATQDVIEDRRLIGPYPIWPEWWLCYRMGPVSGKYIGLMTAPNAGNYELDLRVDIDPRYPNSPVLDRVSGDVFRVYTFN